MENLGIYVHIPFCIKKCYYCDFISYEKKEELVEEYIQALLNEIKEEAKQYKQNKIDTIYIGGGTPSSINSTYIKDIVETIYNNYKVLEDAEIAIEINPGTVDKNKLEEYKQVGVNRISIGLQSTNNEILKQIGRIHNYENFLETYKLARDVGFNNINVDLMLALPNQTIEVLEDSLKQVINLKPEHISLYSLILEEETKLYKQYEQGILKLPDDDVERKMYWNTKKILEEAGYIHYEISNFAKEGYYSKHNMNCWNQNHYLGFGVAAHSFIGNTRYSNTTSLKKYIESKDRKDIRIVEEILDNNGMQKEYMMLGLRKLEGINIQEFKTRFIQNPIYIFKNELEKLEKQNLIIIDGSYIKLTKLGLDFANTVWECFI